MDQYSLDLTNGRDPRIDFFRGAALFMILFDHVGGDPLSKLTYSHFGLSDAAEIFVFLSGVSCSIAYSRILMRRGWLGLFTAVIKRAALIYVFYLTTSLVIILLITAANALTHPDPIQPFVTLPELPPSAIVSSIFLTSPPDLAGILVLYILLTLLVVPLFLAGAQFNAAIALAVSAIIWMISQLYPWLSPPLAENSHFPLLSWQFLFSIGMFVGLRYYAYSASLLLAKNKNLLCAAFMIVALGFFYKVVRHFSMEYQVWVEWFPSPEDFQHMKERLSLVRLAHFLSVAFLVATYITDRKPIFRSSVAQALIQTGRHSLEVFCISAILSVLLNLLVSVFYPNMIERLVLDCCAVVVVLLTVGALREFRQRSEHYSFPRI